MGLGTILVNFPNSGVLSAGGEAGPFQVLFEMGISTELFPFTFIYWDWRDDPFSAVIAKSVFAVVWGSSSIRDFLYGNRGRLIRI